MFVPEQEAEGVRFQEAGAAWVRFKVAYMQFLRQIKEGKDKAHCYHYASGDVAYRSRSCYA